jgi:hypothetical protein
VALHITLDIMKTIYIHIGTFKTGTTSIQRFLKDNRELLETRGLYIPSTQLLAHHPLPLSLIKKYSRWRGGWRDFQGGPDEIWSRMLDEISQTDCQKVLISSESFCDLVNENCRQSSDIFGKYLKSKLEPYDVKIICYLRGIEPYLKSIYQESIKITSRTISMSQEVEGLFQRESIHLKPSIYLDFFSRLFGQDSIIVREYSKGKLAGGDSVKDILGIFGCADLYDEDTAIRSNPSLTAREIKIKRALNACAPDSYEFHHELTRLIALSKEISSDKSIEGSIPAHIATEIDDEQKKIANHYGLEFSKEIAGQLVDDSEPALSAYDFLVLSLLSKVIAQNELLLSKDETRGRSLTIEIRRGIRSFLQRIGITKLR